jgi:transmembrane protein
MRMNDESLAFIARSGCMLLVAPFFLSGIFKLMDFAGTTEEVAALSGLEPAWVFAVLTIAVQIGGSLLVAFGNRWGTLAGAFALGGFTVVATLLAHSWWTKEGIERVRDFNVFFEHVAIVGGFVLAAAFAWHRRA